MPGQPPPRPNLHRLARKDAPGLAYQHIPGQGPLAVWLCGFKSDMAGAKAEWLADRARETGRAFLRFDYRGCGASEGQFEEGTIGLWLQDALAMLDHHAGPPLVLIGSSMGGWIALLAALARPERVKALVLIAPAPDFTERLMWPGLPEDARREVLEKGVWLRPSAYGDGPYPITRALIEDGRKHLLLDAPIAFAGPVRILHGQADADVPWGLSLVLAERLESQDVRTILIKDGGHRLSRPEDLALLDAAIVEVS